MSEELLRSAQERKRKLLELTQVEVGKARTGLGDDPKLLRGTVPVNVLGVDEILGGGFRKGRMAMVVGHESTGKTLFTQWVIKAFQEQGEVCGFIDPEKTYESHWFTVTGVNVADLIVAQPGSTEQAFDLAITWATNGMGLIVMDSLAALTPKARMESDLSAQEFMGLGPRKISEGLNKFTNENTEALLLCTNQLRTKLGIVYGSPDLIPGGRAQMFYASYIIQVKRKGWITEGEKKRVGYHMQLVTIKNKLAMPYQETMIPFMFTGVVDTVGGALDLAMDLGLITGKGGYYVWNDVRYHGKRKLAEVFQTQPEELGKLQEMIQMGADFKGDTEEVEEFE